MEPFLKNVTYEPCKVVTSISLYLKSEERWNIMELRPSQRRTRDIKQICCGIFINVKMDGRISQH